MSAQIYHLFPTNGLTMTLGEKLELARLAEKNRLEGLYMQYEDYDNYDIGEARGFIDGIEHALRLMRKK